MVVLQQNVTAMSKVVVFFGDEPREKSRGVSAFYLKNARDWNEYTGELEMCK